MSAETEGSSPADQESEIIALSTQLGEAITELPEYQAYESARVAVTEDDTAQAQIRKFEQQRREFAAAQQAGEASEDDLMAIKELQQELHSLPVMEEYLEAQADLEERLEDINTALSDPLSIDFGTQVGGCCEE